MKNSLPIAGRIDETSWKGISALGLFELSLCCECVSLTQLILLCQAQPEKSLLRPHSLPLLSFRPVHLWHSKRVLYLLAPLWESLQFTEGKAWNFRRLCPLIQKLLLKHSLSLGLNWSSERLIGWSALLADPGTEVFKARVLAQYSFSNRRHNGKAIVVANYHHEESRSALGESYRRTSFRTARFCHRIIDRCNVR